MPTESNPKGYFLLKYFTELNNGRQKLSADDNERTWMGFYAEENIWNDKLNTSI